MSEAEQQFAFEFEEMSAPAKAVRGASTTDDGETDDGETPVPEVITTSELQSNSACAMNYE